MNAKGKTYYAATTPSILNTDTESILDKLAVPSNHSVVV